jgi:hypothetical protein
MRILANIDGLVANTFQLSGDSRSHEQEAHVRPHGLMGGRKGDGAIVDFNLQIVDLVLLAVDFRTEELIAFDQASYGCLEHGFRQASHQDQLLQQILHLFVEVALH